MDTSGKPFGGGVPSGGLQGLVRPPRGGVVYVHTCTYVCVCARECREDVGTVRRGTVKDRGKGWDLTPGGRVPGQGKRKGYYRGPVPPRVHSVPTMDSRLVPGSIHEPAHRSLSSCLLHTDDNTPRAVDRERVGPGQGERDEEGGLWFPFTSLPPPPVRTERCASDPSLRPGSSPVHLPSGSEATSPLVIPVKSVDSRS